MPDTAVHEAWMRSALREAHLAFDADEIPVGALVVAGNKLLAKGHNQTEALQDPTAHAEMIAITAATNALGAKYLKGCTLYVTLEPCPMCAAALKWSQIETIVVGAPDPERGYAQYKPHLLHPKTEVITGILADDSKALLDQFFQRIRRKR